MNILITGSSGQIGTNLAIRLMERGDSIIGIDKRPNAWTDAIDTRIADLTRDDPSTVTAGAKFDLVVHLAANAKVHELVQHPERAMDNISMSFTVIDYCRKNNLPIVYASSREVYGDIHRHITHEAEADFVVAESPYSASKLAGEALVYSYGQCYDLPFLVFRFSNVYGRFDNDLARMERVIPLFYDRIARDQPITVFGREKVLDFTYVDDCVTGVVAGIDALANRNVTKETINLACGQGSTLVDVVTILALALGKTPDVTYEPARVGEVTRYVADIGKAGNLLDYKPTTPLTEGLVKTVEWYKKTEPRP
jgi:UDP-glucuronate 4-epimerase